MTRRAAGELGEPDRDTDEAQLADLLDELEPPGSLQDLAAELGISLYPRRKRTRRAPIRSNPTVSGETDAFKWP